MKTKTYLVSHVQNLSWICYTVGNLSKCSLSIPADSCDAAVSSMQSPDIWQNRVKYLLEIVIYSLCLGSELWGNQLCLKEEHTEIGVNLLCVPIKRSRKVKRSGLVEAEGTGCTKEGEDAMQRVGFRNRNLFAHLCSGFVMGKVTTNCY